MVYMTETKTCHCGRTFYNTDCIRFECDVCAEDWKVAEELSKLYNKNFLIRVENGPICKENKMTIKD